jgi:hypothetical protein
MPNIRKTHIGFTALIVMVASALLFCSISIFAQDMNKTASTKSITMPSSKGRFLYEPTGKYKVGFKDFLWVNKSRCPDPSAPKGRSAYFSKKNKKHCREVIVRIYYPSNAKEVLSSHYPKYAISSIKHRLHKITEPRLKAYIKQHIGRLDALRLHAKYAAPIVKGGYPVIIFSPGAIDNPSEYSNLLINVASHGYMVVAISDTFLTTVQLPNGTVIPVNTKMNSVSHIVELYKLKFYDMQFVYSTLMKLSKHPGKTLFSSMNMSDVGVLGHSGGASAVIAMAHQYPHEIQAAIALDAPNQTHPKANINLQKAGVIFPRYFDIFSGFSVPMLQMHSSYAPHFLGAPNDAFKLSKDNYLVTITCGKGDAYFKHMDFSSYPLFDNVPFIQHVDEELQKHHKENPIFPSWGYGRVTGDVAIKTVSKYVLSFFNHALKATGSGTFLRYCRPLTKNTQIRCGR